MRYVFSASVGTEGPELWVTDGTAGGTTRVADIYEGPSGSFPAQFYSLNGRALFIASNEVSGRELWISDGTAAGTGIVKDAIAGTGSPTYSTFRAAAGNFAYLLVNDGASGLEVWATDGSAGGTNSLGDIVPGFGTSNAFRSLIVPDYGDFGNLLVFAASDASGDREPWITNGSASGTQRLSNLNPTGSSNPVAFAAAGSRLVFQANDGTGAKLWSTNGTAAGTVKLLDLSNSLDPDSLSNFGSYIELGSRVVLRASIAGQGSELWATDGTAAGTRMLTNVAGTGGADPRGFVAAGGLAYFSGFSTASGRELWATDGTEAGTRLIRDFTPGTADSTLGALTAFGNRAVFTAAGNFYVTSGTDASTVLLLNSAATGGSVSILAVAGSNVYFRTGASTMLWVTDGTAAGTKQLVNIPGLSNSGAVAVGNSAIVLEVMGGVTRLWGSNGTAAGTQPLNNNLAVRSDLAAVFEQPSAPTDITLSAVAAAEYSAAGTLVGTLTTADADAGETFAYALLNNAGGRFALAGNQVRVANGLLLDFEQAASHAIQVRVTDSDGLIFTKTFNISVGNRAPETITGDSANNTFVGGAGADVFKGAAGNDTLNGAGDNDSLYGGIGADSHIGGGGIDYARYDDANYGNLRISLAAPATNTGAAAGDTYSGIEGIIAGAGNDLIYGDGAANYLYGLGGNDNIYGGLGADRIDGGAGVDYARYDDANYGNLRVSLIAPATNTGAAAAGDTYAGIEGIVTGSGNDLIYGNGGDNTLNGNKGNDTLFGGLGADLLIGGDGIDYARYDDASYGNLVVSLLNPAANTGAAAGDRFSGIEGIIAGAGNDRVDGNTFVNYLYGGGGNDTIVGNAGSDTLSGGAGLDTFVFNSALNAASNIDKILDFSVADDTIWIDRTYFGGLAAGALNAANFRIGAAAADADDRIIYNAATGALIFDANGNAAGGATQFATLSAVLALTAADFQIIA